MTPGFTLAISYPKPTQVPASARICGEGGATTQTARRPCNADIHFPDSIHPEGDGDHQGGSQAARRGEATVPRSRWRVESVLSRHGAVRCRGDLRDAKRRGGWPTGPFPRVGGERPGPE